MKKIRWGVLGTADIAHGCTIPGMQLTENCELYAIAGRSLEKAERFRAEFGFEKAYGSYDALLADDAVEAVYIPLPNALHCEWVVKAAKAGKHILCEKPMAASAAEAETMFRAAEDNGVLLMEAFAYLHSPLTAAIKREIDSGVIGEVRYMENAFVTSGIGPSNFRMHREMLGGGVYDLGCYCTSQMLWLLGEPERVAAVADYADTGVDRFATGFLRYPNGACGAFTCGMALADGQGRRLDRLQIHGTKGKLLSDAEYNQKGELTYRVVTADGCVEHTVSAPDNYGLEVAQLGRCIAGEETPFVSKAFTLANARVLDRVLDAIGYWNV